MERICTDRGEYVFIFLLHGQEMYIDQERKKFFIALLHVNLKKNYCCKHLAIIYLFHVGFCFRHRLFFGLLHDLTPEIKVTQNVHK